MPKPKDRPNFEEIVVNAIKLLQAAEGSTANEIVKYVKSEYDLSIANTTGFKNHLKYVIKRGLDSGLIQKSKRGYTTWSNKPGLEIITAKKKKDDKDNDTNNNNSRRRITRASFFDWYQRVVAKKDMKRSKRGKKKASNSAKSKRTSRSSMVTRSQTKSKKSKRNSKY